MSLAISRINLFPDTVFNCVIPLVTCLNTDLHLNAFAQLVHFAVA